MVNENALTPWKREVQELTGSRNRLVRIEGIPVGESERWNIRAQAYNAFSGYTCNGQSLIYFTTAVRANHFINHAHKLRFMGSTVSVVGARDAKLTDYLLAATMARRECQARGDQFYHF